MPKETVSTNQTLFLSGQASVQNGSERDIFVTDRRRSCGRCRRRFMLGRALIEIVRSVSTRGIAATLTTAAKQHQIAGHDFSHVTLLVCLLVLPRAGLQAALNVNLAALFQ